MTADGVTERSVDAALRLAARGWIDAVDVRALIQAEARYEGGVTALAKLWGVSKAHISDLCRGTRTPGPEILDRLGLRKEVTVRYYAAHLHTHSPRAGRKEG